MDDFLSCCEIVLRINRMEKQLEKLGIVLESNFLIMIFMVYVMML